MNIKQLIEEAFQEAFLNHEESNIPSILHRERSRHFVEALVKVFKGHYNSDKNVYVLSKYDYGNREKFGVNELLFDILVCKGATITSSSRQKELTYIIGSIWQVESEFAKNSRQSIFDFNKLVLGSSENKLFIGPQVTKEENYLKMLATVAKYCQGKTYLALLPHPREWAYKKEVKCWVFQKGWESI